MNIRFLAQSEYFNGIHLKDDIILEKEYDDSDYDLPFVRYYLYYLEENIRNEVLPETKKIDVFDLTECRHDSDFIYFTEIQDDNNDCSFNIIRYNIIDHTHQKIISLKDDIGLYPDKKEIKIFILDDSNLIIQKTVQNEDKTPATYSLILFNFVKSRQYVISDDNFTQNGIDYIIPVSDTNCLIKTGSSKFLGPDTIESLMITNINQFITDAQLEQTNIIMPAFEKAYGNTKITEAKVMGPYIVYSKTDIAKNEETVTFYDYKTKDVFNCINKSDRHERVIDNAVIINDNPYFLTRIDSGTQFFNLKKGQIDTEYSPMFDICYVNNYTIVAKKFEQSLMGKELSAVTIFRFPSHKSIATEKGVFLGAVASNSETTYIFLK